MPSPSLPEAAPALRLVVLAGRVGNMPEPRAGRFAWNQGAVASMADEPPIVRVLRTASRHPSVVSLAICVERDAFDSVWDMLTRLPGRGTVALVPAREDVADSVRDAARGWEGSVIVATADPSFLTVEAIDAVAGALAHADAAIALAPRRNADAAAPSGVDRFLSFRDGDYTVCNIYGIAGPWAAAALETFRATGLKRIGPRIRHVLGIRGLLLLRGRLLTLSGATALASRHLGLRLATVVLPDGAVRDDASIEGVAKDKGQEIAESEASSRHEGNGRRNVG